MRALGLGTLLHDIGREKIPSQILLNKSPWTKAELSFYHQHVAYGVEMAQRLPGISAAALDVIAMHHELLDAAGTRTNSKASRSGASPELRALPMLLTTTAIAPIRRNR